MKAIQATTAGNPTVLQLCDLPQPKPGPGEAVIRIRAAGVNYVDIYMRNGGIPMQFPFVPGVEGAGIVEGVGSGVSEVRVGDRVAYAGNIGSYAEYCAVKASHLIPVPKEMSFEHAAAFPLQGMTAHYLVHDHYHLKNGDTVLVHAAAGGMGLLLVQWLKHKGVRVVGTVSTEEKAKVARQAGADHVILYTKQDFVAEVKGFTEGRGADYIIDGVGKSTFTKNLEAVRKRGHICIYGAASGPADPLSPNSLMAKSITISGGSLVNYLTTRDELLRRASDVLNGMREGWLKLTIGRVLPLEQAGEAHGLLEGRQSVGKLILKID